MSEFANSSSAVASIAVPELAMFFSSRHRICLIPPLSITAYEPAGMRYILANFRRSTESPHAVVFRLFVVVCVMFVMVLLACDVILRYVSNSVN